MGESTIGAHGVVLSLDEVRGDPGVYFDQERQLQRVVSGYIRFYSERRLHSSIGQVAPATYEQNLSCRGVN
jgi:hypothetical protein